MPAIHIDASRHPIVVVTFVGAATDAEFQDYLASMENMMVMRRGTNCTILDATRAGNTPALQRRMQADWLKRNEELLRKHSAGTAFVINSPLVRGLLTAILWMSPMATPHTVVASLDEAERWAAAQLRARGVEPPAPGSMSGDAV
jgi:hypothetical protein